jgi:hypothetical protein
LQYKMYSMVPERFQIVAINAARCNNLNTHTSSTRYPVPVAGIVPVLTRKYWELFELTYRFSTTSPFFYTHTTYSKITKISLKVFLFFFVFLTKIQLKYIYLYNKFCFSIHMLHPTADQAAVPFNKNYI